MHIDGVRCIGKRKGRGDSEGQLAHTSSINNPNSKDQESSQIAEAGLELDSLRAMGVYTRPAGRSRGACAGHLQHKLSQQQTAETQIELLRRAWS